MPDPIRGVNATDGAGVNPTGGTPTGASASQPPSSPATPAVDSANVTQAETLLAAIDTMAASVPGIDQAKVTQIQQAIASGTYQVNAQNLAQKMLEIERLLTGASPPGA